MDIKDFMYDGKGKFEIADQPTDNRRYDIDKKDAAQKTQNLLSKIGELQDKLYAEAKEGLIIVFQGIDASGKNSTIKHVMSGINPQGVNVSSFKQPCSEELAHDYLWRAEKCIPRRGSIEIMDRSYYEDVLVVKVHNYQKSYNMPTRCISMDSHEFFERRYRQIRNYEEYLYENGYRIIKIFLNVSKDKQKERFLERIDNPSKNWKFAASDLKDRALWDKYQKVFEEAIVKTATEDCPWFVVPADKKWFARYIVSQIILNTLEDMNPHYPQIPPEERAKLGEYREMLINEE